MPFPWSYILTAYLLILNLTGFLMMGIDKKRAVRHQWRIKEATLFLAALLGGSAGTILGMYVFRHKTKHWYFVAGMPCILVIELALGILLWYKLR